MSTMQSSDLSDEHIGGQLTAAIEGTITGLIRGPGWTEVQVDVGLPGDSVVQLRLVDADPIDVTATTVPQELNPAPPVDTEADGE